MLDCYCVWPELTQTAAAHLAGNKKLEKKKKKHKTKLSAVFFPPSVVYRLSAHMVILRSKKRRHFFCHCKLFFFKSSYEVTHTVFMHCCPLSSS